MQSGHINFDSTALGTDAIVSFPAGQVTLKISILLVKM